MFEPESVVEVEGTRYVVTPHHDVRRGLTSDPKGQECTT